MKKNSLSYKDLSKQGLENLKETYVQHKINSMSQMDLRQFVFESISHQIKDTIGHEEEEEAWSEMENFFEEQFELIIKEIQNKFPYDKSIHTKNESSNNKKIDLQEININENHKLDMWED
tara:strand:- start:98 stop:457 length:360 start_codon:yes stop_codon:yes gene_type:complete